MKTKEREAQSHSLDLQGPGSPPQEKPQEMPKAKRKLSQDRTELLGRAQKVSKIKEVSILPIKAADPSPGDF